MSVDISPAIIISSIAIIISFTALIWNIIQWIFTRRPYLAMVSLDWSTVDPDRQYFWDGAKCTIKNVGQAPAKGIKFTGETTIDGKTEEFSKELGVLFPTQEMGISIAFSDKTNMDFLLSGYASLLISACIAYQGTLPFQNHVTKQNAELFDKPRWIAFLPGGEAK